MLPNIHDAAAISILHLTPPGNKKQVLLNTAVLPLIDKNAMMTLVHRAVGSDEVGISGKA
jgi:hypothetical protein